MMAGRTVRIGIIGAGFGVQHPQGYGLTENAEVAACCRRTKGKAEPLAQEFGMPHVYTDPPESTREARARNSK